jgi:autotransporter passenger strand-loop-strand repeat protein
MTMFTAPPDQTDLVLNTFDILNVFKGGMATGTIINQNAVENVYSGGTALFTIVNGSSVLNILGKGIGTTIDGGNENVAGGGTVIDTTINKGGSELLNAGTTSIGTIINEAGVQSVLGTAKGTIINGGLENVFSGGIADGVIFAGHHSTLALAMPSELTGIIRNWHVGDVIDFLNTKVTGVNEVANKVTVSYGDHQTASYLLAGQQANTHFALQSDNHGGTDLVLTSGVGVHHLPIDELQYFLADVGQFLQAGPPIIGIQHLLSEFHFV